MNCRQFQKPIIHIIRKKSDTMVDTDNVLRLGRASDNFEPLLLITEEPFRLTPKTLRKSFVWANQK